MLSVFVNVTVDYRRSEKFKEKNVTVLHNVERA